MKMSGQNGQAVIEAATVIPFWFLFLGLFLTASYFLFGKFSLERNLYESLICLSEHQTVYQCETQLRQSIKDWLPIGTVQSLTLTKRSEAYTARLSWGFTQTLRLNFHKALPLEEVVK